MAYAADTDRPSPWMVMTRQLRRLLCHVSAGKLTQHAQTAKPTRPDCEAAPAKDQFTTAGHRCAAESTLERAHTHSHTRQTRCKRTHTRSHPVRRSRSRAPLLHYHNRFVLLFSVGIVSNQEKTEKQGRRTEGRKKTQILPPSYSAVSIKRAFDFR